MLVRGKSSARVSYGIGCVTLVKENQTFVVPSEDVCTTGSVNGSLKDVAVTSDPSEPGIDGIVVGGMVVAGAGIAVALDNNDKPASP